jgi:hypothetical protein
MEARRHIEPHKAGPIVILHIFGTYNKALCVTACILKISFKIKISINVWLPNNVTIRLGRMLYEILGKFKKQKILKYRT